MFTDCFAYKRVMQKEKCTALKESLCEKGNCRFFKTEQQIAKENEEMEKRIRNLYRVDSITFVEMRRKCAKD